MMMGRISANLIHFNRACWVLYVRYSCTFWDTERDSGVLLLFLFLLFGFGLFFSKDTPHTTPQDLNVA